MTILPRQRDTRAVDGTFLYIIFVGWREGPFLKWTSLTMYR